MSQHRESGLIPQLTKNRRLLAVVVALCVLLAGFVALRGPGAVADEPDPELNLTSASAQDYRRLINDIRRRVSVGPVYDNIARTDPSRNNRYSPIILRNGDREVRLIMRESDLYLMGWWDSGRNTYFRFRADDGADFRYTADDNTRLQDVDYFPTYRSLESRSPTSRVQMRHGLDPMRNAVEVLATADPGSNNAAEAFLQMAQALSEAARFRPTEDTVADNWGNPARLAPELVDAQTKWGTISSLLLSRLGTAEHSSHTYGGVVLNTLQAFTRLIAVALISTRHNQCGPGSGHSKRSESAEFCGVDGRARLAALPNPHNDTDHDGHPTHDKDEVYFFSGDQNVLIDVAPGSTDDKIVNGPKPTAENWPGLKDNVAPWVDAVLPHPTNKKRAYFFSGDQYLQIEFTPGSTDDKIINGPSPIEEHWPSLKEAGFARSGVDAILPNPANRDEAYFFSGGQYALIDIAPGGNGDTIVNGPKPIVENWPSLKEASDKAADSGSRADFTSGITGAVLNPGDGKQAYFFSQDQYVRVTVSPGSRDDSIVNGPSPVTDHWPSLKEAGFF
ncbi:ribosome-inactivating family protein [Streptomyces sp. KR80]|uniref:ribosome-inactivating family protein n=1 Tax=Streptomyces sp. KR80 TaxID=3457426 RepID=UPI003FCFA2F6